MKIEIKSLPKLQEDKKRTKNNTVKILFRFKIQPTATCLRSSSEYNPGDQVTLSEVSGQWLSGQCLSVK